MATVNVNPCPRSGSRRGPCNPCNWGFDWPCGYPSYPPGFRPNPSPVTYSAKDLATELQQKGIDATVGQKIVRPNTHIRGRPRQRWRL